jgi:hypothetical protein
MTLEEAIRAEQLMYVRYCEEAARHDNFEGYYRAHAHHIFYHIQEMRSTGEVTPLARFLSPIQ